MRSSKTTALQTIVRAQDGQDLQKNDHCNEIAIEFVKMATLTCVFYEHQTIFKVVALYNCFNSIRSL